MNFEDGIPNGYFENMARQQAYMKRGNMSDSNDEIFKGAPTVTVGVNPGKVIQVIPMGNTMGALTDTGQLFVFGKKNNNPEDTEVGWDHLPAPTAEDMKRSVK